MKIATRLLLATCLVLPLAACKKEEAVTVEAAPVALVAPAKTDDAGWKAYLSEVVLRNMGEITNQPFLYYLPNQADPEFQAKYDRQLEQAKNAIARGIVGGNLSRSVRRSRPRWRTSRWLRSPACRLTP